MAKVYISGPMRGYPQYNFPAFDAARDRFKEWGWHVISPADLDRQFDGLDPLFDPKGTQKIVENWTHTDLVNVIMRDTVVLWMLDPAKDDAIAMLPYWEASTGAVAELYIARWLGLQILNAETGKLLDEFNATDLRETLLTYLEKHLQGGNNDG